MLESIFESILNHKMTSMYVFRLLHQFERSIILMNFLFYRYMPDILFDWFSKYAAEHKMDLKILHSFTESVINTRRQLMLSEGAETNSLTDSGKRRRLAFLDLLLKVQLENSGGKNELTDEDIREEVGFLLASHWLENLSFEKCH